MIEAADPSAIAEVQQCGVCSVVQCVLSTHVLWCVSLVGLSGLGSLAKQHGDEMEMQLSKKLHLGDRVIVQLKRTSEHIRGTAAC